MLVRKPAPLLAVMVVVIFTIGQCQENESRRAVTEHQLMHDRGRTIQSLKRLIWLSGAMEGLHTAQTRSSLFPPPVALNLALNPAQVPNSADRNGPRPARVDNQQKVALEGLLRDFFTSPYLTALSEEEP